MDKLKISNLKDKELLELSSKMLLSLNLEEMKAIQKYFVTLKREPSLTELEIIAQVWSEHCIHKTMTGVIEFRWKTEDGKWNKEIINNLLKETIFRSTEELDKNYCLSVFKDNAGIIELNEEYGIAMKVETHNHPSAIEPYGGAATGIGGVIRDILGCGQGAKPVLNIDVFCFGHLDTHGKDIPQGVLHPKRIFRGVVKGVRDYGNRMGIPTSSGAIVFDNDYIFNPLIYCGTIGVIPKKFIYKKVSPWDLIVVIGGRTGRDGIHGATFSSTGLDKEVDAGCVQIGDPITEKKFTDVLLKLRDLQLYSAITDCGAGGFSSAISEMGRDTGAEVFLDKAPLKYKGLKPWEIFLSESQERMVLSVPVKNMRKLKEMLEKEDVESAVLGEFTDTKKLKIFYQDGKEADLDMGFLHNGVPKIVRKAVRVRVGEWGMGNGEWGIKDKDLKVLIRKVMSHPNVASKEAVIRQYDHEVQGGSVSKPLCGITQDVPQDGCVTRPILDSMSGIAVGLGINPLYGKIDSYYMAMSNCGEAARNVVACGGEINRAAFMDNFCWGDITDEKILGELVMASRGCYDAAKILNIPFVSGKDSLNNCYYLKDKKVNIPGTLLITCVAPHTDIEKVAGSDFKKPENIIYLIGETYDETGGSILREVLGIKNGVVPRLRKDISLKILIKVQGAIKKRFMKSCHDLSDGGLSSGLIEMCFSGVGAEIDLSKMNNSDIIVKLFSESNSRFLVEVDNKDEKSFEEFMQDIPFYRIGHTLKEKVVRIKESKDTVVYEDSIQNIKSLWKSPIKW